MRPVLFRWRTLTIWSYPAMLYVGLVLGVVAGNLAAHAARLDAVRVYAATFMLIIPALAGARLLHVFAEWKIYRQNRSLIWDRTQSGYVMYGGLPLTLVLSLPLLRWLHIGVGAFWDVAIFTILVGMFFTRIGCLLHGCCAGRPTSGSFGFYLPDSFGIWKKRVPSQALEAGWAAILLVVALILRRSAPFPGALFLFISAAYACGRLLMEYGRQREVRSGTTLVRVTSLVIVALSLSGLTLYWH